MYRSPVRDIAFTLKHVAGVGPAMEAGALGDLSEDLLDAILEEAGKFASDEIAPLYKVGDTQVCKAKDGVVTLPDGRLKVRDNSGYHLTIPAAQIRMLRVSD